VFIILYQPDQLFVYIGLFYCRFNLSNIVFIILYQPDQFTCLSRSISIVNIILFANTQMFYP